MTSTALALGFQFVLILSLCHLQRAKSACPLCGNDLLFKSISLQDNNLQIPDLPNVSSCRDLQPILQTTNDDEILCKSLQKFVGGLCGCPLPPVNSSPSCERFCLPDTNNSNNNNRSPLTNPHQEIPDLQEIFEFTPTCLLLQNFLLYNQTNCDKDNTTEAEQFYYNSCVCDNQTNINNNDLSELSSRQQQQQEQKQQISCDICPLEEYDLESVRDKQILPVVHMGPYRDDAQNVNRLVEKNLTCETLYQLSLLESAQDTNLCRFYTVLNNQCGCFTGAFFIFFSGQWTRHQNVMASWIPRCSGFISLLFSGMVLLDILLDKNKRKKSYCLIVLGIAGFDFISALGWLPSTLFVPPVIDGVRFGWHGSSGNEATCTLQGFLIQLGTVTSVFFSVALIVYYKLTIVNGWKETKIKSHRWSLCGIPLFLGVSLALGGIPLYRPLLYACHMVSYFPVVWKPMFFFMILPLMLSILALAGILIHVYLHVRRTYATSDKWTLSFALNRQDNVNGNSNTNESSGGVGPLPSNTNSRSNNSKNSQLINKVFGQMVSYMLAFYIIWPVLIGFFFRDNFDFVSTYVALFFLPLQGFADSLVYFRPRIKRWMVSLWNRVLLKCSRPHGQAEGEEEEEESMRRMEPSVAVAH